MATTAGTPALAMPLKSCRRVIDTSVLFLAGWLLGRRFQFLGVGAVGCNARDSRFHAAVETLRCNPRGSSDCTCDGADQGCRADFELARGTEDWRICFGRRRQMDWDGFKCSHLPHHALFGATQARRADPDGPHAGNFIEVPSGAGGVSDRSLAAEFVQAISLAMSFVAERRGESSCIKVSAPRAA